MNWWVCWAPLCSSPWWWAEGLRSPSHPDWDWAEESAETRSYHWTGPAGGRGGTGTGIKTIVWYHTYHLHTIWIFCWIFYIKQLFQPNQWQDTLLETCKVVHVKIKKMSVVIIHQHYDGLKNQVNMLLNIWLFPVISMYVHVYIRICICVCVCV